MKKLITLALALIMAMTMTVAASAAFVSSPSASDGPVIENITAEEGKDAPEVLVTPYKDRENLDVETKEEMEGCYASIKDADNLVELVPSLKAAADKAGVKEKDLAVSELFNLSLKDDEKLDGKITITLKPDALKNFVALMSYENGKWVVVEGVVFDADKGTITFDADKLSTLAIVVNNAEDKDSPATGNAFDFSIFFMVGAVLFGAAAAFCFAKSRVNG